jgi:hypothetical protein
LGRFRVSRLKARERVKQGGNSEFRDVISKPINSLQVAYSLRALRR